MTARIANGGRAVRPHLILPELPYPAPDLGFDPEHLRLVRRAMYRVSNAEQGTAFATTHVADEALQIAGKTGTAQVARLSPAERLLMLDDIETLDYERRNHGLFVGFGPVDNPRYACAAVVEHGNSGSLSAAPVVRDLLHAAIAGNSGDDPDRASDPDALVDQGRNA